MNSFYKDIWMKKFPLTHHTLFSLISATLFVTPLAAESLTSSDNLKVNELAVVKKIHTIIDAVPETRVNPKYPINEARKGRDGWVELSFIVEPDGSTSNVIVKGSSGSKSFEKEAIRAAKKWKYSPAIENGKAIQQCNNSVQLDFMIARKAGVTKKFSRLYKEFTNAISAKDTDKVEKLYPKMRDYKLYAKLESYYQYSALSLYEENFGSKEKQYDYLNKAIRFSGSHDYFKTLKNQEVISSTGVKVKPGEDAEAEKAKSKKSFNKHREQSLAPVLHQKLVLELDLNKLANALNTIDKLLLLSVNRDNHAAYKNQQRIIQNFMLSDSPYQLTGGIGQQDFWYHSLLRNEFTITDIKGELHKIDIRCSNKRHVYTVNEQSKWTIPSSWKNCSLYIYGDDNTKFTLVEMNPAKPSEAQEVISD